MRTKLSALLIAAMVAIATLTGALPFSEVTMSHAQVTSQDKPRERTITINGSGRVTAEPDIATIQTGVVSEAPTAAEALARNTTDMRKVVDTLKAAGIDPKDLQTSNFNVSPHYAQSKDGNAPRITGYQVSNQLIVSVRKLASLGDILDKVVTGGANQVGAIHFEVSKADSLKDEARKLAIANARRRAELYATAAGVQLGDVLTISEDGASFEPQPRVRGAMMASAGPAPIEAGSQALDVTVRVTWGVR